MSSQEGRPRSKCDMYTVVVIVDCQVKLFRGHVSESVIL